MHKVWRYEKACCVLGTTGSLIFGKEGVARKEIAEVAWGTNMKGTGYQGWG